MKTIEFNVKVTLPDGDYFSSRAFKDDIANLHYNFINGRWSVVVEDVKNEEDLP